MKTIYENEIYDVTLPSTDIMQSLPSGDSCHILLKSGERETVCKVLVGYNMYEYIECPMLFIPLVMSDGTRLHLIRKFDEWYGDTAIDVSWWCLEFQYIVRMLLCNYFIVNPRYLNLDDVIQDVITILNKGVINNEV